MSRQGWTRLRSERVMIGVPVLGLLALAGCASQMQLLQEYSARLIACPMEAVVVTNVQRSGTRPRSWNVACQDQAWVCAREWARVRCVRVEPALPEVVPDGGRS